jgi:hypothetical protein
MCSFIFQIVIRISFVVKFCQGKHFRIDLVEFVVNLCYFLQYDKLLLMILVQLPGSFKAKIIKENVLSINGKYIMYLF